MRVIIVGAGRVGRSLAEQLVGRGESVVIIDTDQRTVETARSAGFTTHHGDGTDTSVLQSAGIENAKTVAATTANDDVNLLIAQLTNSKFDVETVIARVNTPDNVEAFEELGVRAISASDAIAQEMDNAIERPALSEWMTDLGRDKDVQEIEVTAEWLIGKSIRELDEFLPDGVLVALVSCDGDAQIPKPDLTLQHGTRLTFVGQRDTVRSAIAQCHPQ